MLKERRNREVQWIGGLLVALAVSGASAEERRDVETTTPSSARVVLARQDSAEPTSAPSDDARQAGAAVTAVVADADGESESAPATTARSDASIALPPRDGADGPSAVSGRPLPLNARHVPWYRHGVVALSVVLGVIFGLLWLLRRYVPSVRKAPSGPLRVVARTTISPKQSVALLEVGRRYVLVGITADHLTNLGHIQDPDESFRLRAQAVDPRPAGRQNRFDELLSHEAAEYAEVEAATPSVGPPSREQLQDTMGQLQGLLGRLRSLQGRPAR
ncbi:MAG: flagellar biosynthetic protein FliO [Phycisphaerae bacterium]|nr:flagellar biosynthetic protein FliO [Phycisphaerae bacterium]